MKERGDGEGTNSSRAQASGSLGLAALAATTSQRLSSGCDLGKWAAVGWREVRRYVDMRCGYIVYEYMYNVFHKRTGHTSEPVTKTPKRVNLTRFNLWQHQLKVKPLIKRVGYY
jgi:hypothetical protein